MNEPNATSVIDRAAGLVRKAIDVDCLLNTELHPSVADRLQRVRDLPVTSVANLHGVERDSNGVWLVWQYVDGFTLKEYLKTPIDVEEIARIKRDLRRIVQAMHAHGIVHGAIHANNVMIDTERRVRLTHVSPLLYDDPQQDIDAMEELFRLLEMPAPVSVTNPATQESKERWIRIRGYLAAALSVIAGILIFLTILWYIRA